ncbi:MULTISPECIES: flagellar basal body L-ring protein FlgH [Stappiaceae]|jgi:flagellar L-ring protein precursor FlgH|uniref:Flagellar L-ring protein n=2 Tax=Roseibium TaxID=150830 RepID=A0A0M6XX89_9HYPH|nr:MULTISPECIES: flagellar basal body L-ring protein FlgH [Stappiaceae]MCR9282956.1 flagellar basal body L-ring protein FlgH [Paracoccaceae bacterium]MEC9419084.1 flagellar basal body L-ring protein FlgH [Pseudomonadota bacterium]AMN53360.1 flagellar L-ring protein FlgH [Labrenzia sp. CP4]AQQ06576.1 flagellar basal body L-ring protein [Roseibium aggregatum]ERP97913.1 flagellar L-ring protein FlgH [Labrenzia sp. C1B10]
MRAFVISLGAAMLTGCAGQLEDVGRAPEMSPVGYGLAVQQPAAYPLSTFGQGTVKDYNSLWASGRDNFFADPRAKKVGDVLTVTIQINDRANMDNSSDRRRTSDIGWGGTMDYDWDGIGHGGSGNLGVDSGSGSAGSGSIDRSEEIQLSVAAVVTDRLPNGNLVISGSQEMRVNFEMRILQIAGIVRPRDIQANNTIPYDKIAEARVSYGGRGRITEVQQPAWGQQIYDIVTPF